MSSSFPTNLIGPGNTGQPGEFVNPRSDDYPEAINPDTGRQFGSVALAPLGWNGGKPNPNNSRMVGWTLHPKGNKSQIVAEHAFSINPQAINRTDSPRNQMFATQADFYVDDFGPGPVTIQITQLVAHGRGSTLGGGDPSRATMRQDVIRWYQQIYLQAVGNPGKYDVYFHDNHLWDVVDGRTPELVYFPAQGYQLSRSTQLQNVWQLSITMQTLSRTPAGASQRPATVKTYTVKRGDTLKKIAARLAGGKKATHAQIEQVEQQIINLTKLYDGDDITKKRTLYFPKVFDGQTIAFGGKSVTAKRLQLVPGEKIKIPSG